MSKMKKTTAPLTISLCVFLGLGAPSLRSESLSPSDLDIQYQSAKTAATQTIGTPLIMAELTAADISLPGTSLLSSVNAGSSGDLRFESLGQGKAGIRFENLSKPASFFWRFTAPADLRNRWVRLSYKGEKIPLAGLLTFETGNAGEKFSLYLLPFSRRGETYFKLPDDEAFGGLTVIRFIFDPVLLGGDAVDFRMEDMQILTKGADPLITKGAFHGERPGVEAEQHASSPGQASLIKDGHTS